MGNLDTLETLILPFSSPEFQLTTLGSVLLTRTSDDNSAEMIFRPGKPLALLVYLACSPTKSASREHLINLLWADAEPERGLRTLRQTVWQMRQSLGEDSFLTDGRDLTLNLQLAFDRDLFLVSVAKSDYQEATRVYRGPFLPDFGVPGGAEFEHWSDRERDRLYSSYVRCAEALIRDRLDHARYDSAIQEARRLRDSDPDRESSWRLLLEALSSSGDRLSTLSETEDLERLLANEEREPEALTRSAISRAKKSQLVAPSSDSTSEKLIADLTGRDREFSRLTSAWTGAKSGRTRHIHVSAPPGFGKTRLLRDVFTRLRASGARAVWTAALGGDRRLAYALASDIAARVGVLSGASGISTSAASSLVALNPILSSSFAATADRSDGEEALRRRVHAIVELVQAVTEEAPLALFIDDLHWSDPVSRQLLKSAFARVDGCRLLLVTSSRTLPDADLHLASTERIALEPLSSEHVKQLVSSFGSLPDERWAAPFLLAMHEHSGGSPLLILGNLHLALDRKLLRLHDNMWECTDGQSLISAISRGDVLEQRLKKLEPRLVQLLLVLSIAEEPISATVASRTLSRDRSPTEADLLTLEQQGFALNVEGYWKCGHDSIAETATRMATDNSRVLIHGSLGNVLASDPSASQQQLRLAGQHLTAGCRIDKADESFIRFVALARKAGDRRSNLHLAAAMLGESPATDSARRLASSLPLMQRIGLASRGRAAGAAAIIFLAAILPFQLMPPKAAQLGIISEPLSGNEHVVVPAPVIEIQDRNGRRITGAHDSVTVEMVPEKDGIHGILTVAAVDGRAEFNALTITKNATPTLRFTSGHLKPAESRSMRIGGRAGFLFLVSADLNGQKLDAKHRTVIAHPGGQIAGTVHLVYSSFWSAASVILGATPMWGDRQKDFVDLRPLATPVANHPRSTALQFRAPATPGKYQIVIAFDAEGNVEDFMSGTNWTMPAPIWNDGNDIADWTQDQLEQARTRGWVATRTIKIKQETGRPVAQDHETPATVIDVVVK